MAITPENRMEQILNGELITPENRAEYFTKEAIDNAGSGGSDLPAVTTDDNGDVLTVVEGVWAKAAPSAPLPAAGTAGNVLTSTGTAWESTTPSMETLNVEIYYAGDEGAYKSTKSISEILSAIGNKVINATFDSTPLFVLGASEGAVMLSTFPVDSGLSILGESTGDPAVDEWQVRETSYAPEATSEYNGKVLGVSNGAYALVDALPLIVHGEVNASAATITDSGLTLADIYNAAEAGRSVYYECSLDTNSKTRLSLAGRTLDNGAYELTFSAAAISSNAPAVITVTFDSNGGTFEFAVAQ